MKAKRRRLGEKGLGVRLNPIDGSNRSDIGNRWWYLVNSFHIGTVMIAPMIPVVTVKVTMPWTIPAIGISMGVVIIRLLPIRWLGLGAQGAEGQEKANYQDNGRPSFEVHLLTSVKILQTQDLLVRKQAA